MAAIDWAAYRSIVVLTGAGISVASGLRPYRGPGGLWSEMDVDSVVTAAAVARDPRRVWAFHAEMLRAVAAASPNAAHVALARLAGRLTHGQSLVVLTQNIDGLHQRAGSRDVVELHGSLARSRCTRSECGSVGVVAGEACPACPRCGAWMRPDVVMFDEALPVDAEWHSKRALRDCDLFLAVGTSGTVTPAANFVRSARYAGARTILVNLEPMTPRNPEFSEELLGRAEEVLPELVG
jgi:NAD-dependent deacetylase